MTTESRTLHTGGNDGPVSDYNNDVYYKSIIATLGSVLCNLTQGTLCRSSIHLLPIVFYDTPPKEAATNNYFTNGKATLLIMVIEIILLDILYHHMKGISLFSQHIIITCDI